MGTKEREEWKLRLEEEVKRQRAAFRKGFIRGLSVVGIVFYPEETAMNENEKMTYSGGCTFGIITAASIAAMGIVVVLLGG